MASDSRRIALSNPCPSQEGNPRFVVGGQAGPSSSGDVKMYEWRKSRSEMRMIGLQSDAGPIRAMAWAPFAHQRHLVAAGLSTGRTLLLNLTPSTLAQPVNTTAAPLPASTIGVLPVKHSRQVTALSFSKVDPSYIAIGYERHRSDASLLIWDINEIVSRLPASDDRNQGWTRPHDRLEYTNPSPPLREGSKEVRHVQQYCASEHVNSVAVLPDTIFSLLASANYKVIRLYDLRVPGETQQSAQTNTAASWLTRATQGLAPDPENSDRFASYEPGQGGGVVRLWDTRKAGAELLSFEVGHGGVQALEWATGGRLGVGLRDGGVHLWDMVGQRREDGEGEHVDRWTTVGGMRQIVRPRPNLHCFAFSAPNAGSRDVLVVMKDGTLGIGPVGATPVIRSSAQGLLAVTTPADLRIVDPHVHPSNDEGAVADGSRFFDNQSDHSDEADEPKRFNRFQLAPERVSRLLAEHAEHSISRSSSPGRSSLLRSVKDVTPRELVEDDMVNADRAVDEHEDIVGGWEGVRRIFKADIAYTMRRRAEEGYGLTDLLLNGAIASRHPGKDRLGGIWEFIDHLVRVMGPSNSSHRNFNLTYHGVSAIWNGPDQTTSSPASMRSQSTLVSENSRQPHRQTSAAWSSLINQPGYRHSPAPPPTPERLREKDRVVSETNPDYTAAVQSILSQRQENGQELPSISSGSRSTPPTERGPQRQLILRLCGEDPQHPMAEIQRLVEDEQRTKAACWAYFAGEEGPAISILLNSPNEKHRLMGSTIAGFMSQSRAERGSIFWQEHWRTMVNKTDDPYIRAVLSRIGGDGWDAVLEEEAIPLLDRISIALNNLSDKELSAFFKDRYARCLRHCSLHGLTLTGFTSPGVHLLQAYLERTGDLQTPAILSAFFAPSRLTTSETRTVERWQEAYRDMLDTWRLYSKRSAYDVSRIVELRRLGEAPASSVSGNDAAKVCPVCNNLLTKVGEEHVNRKAALRSTVAWPNERTSTCALCNSSLPRCCICLRHVEVVTGDDDSVISSGGDTLDDAYVSCQTCRHGGHAGHIIPWFEGGLDGEPPHDTCPVAGCECECASL